MSDPETQTTPLIRAPSQQTAGEPAHGGRSNRAFKVAGITMLACLLIAGQALTAYFVLSQRGDIKSLEEQGRDMKAKLQRGRAGAVPVQIHIPMDTMLMDHPVDEEHSTGIPGQTVDTEKATQCQLEAAALNPAGLPNFHPACDRRGLYRPQQCWQTQCWCVDPTSGQVIPGSMRQGPAPCSAARGILSRAMAQPALMQLTDN